MICGAAASAVSNWTIHCQMPCSDDADVGDAGDADADADQCFACDNAWYRAFVQRCTLRLRALRLGPCSAVTSQRCPSHLDCQCDQQLPTLCLHLQMGTHVHTLCWLPPQPAAHAATFVLARHECHATAVVQWPVRCTKLGILCGGCCEQCDCATHCHRRLQWPGGSRTYPGDCHCSRSAVRLCSNLQQLPTVGSQYVAPPWEDRHLLHLLSQNRPPPAASCPLPLPPRPLLPPQWTPSGAASSPPSPRQPRPPALQLPALTPLLPLGQGL
ncbi:hypothetical protein V8C86DRAFT_3029876 [Haematococcus lacustris]